MWTYRGVYFVLMQIGAHHGKVRSGSVQAPFGRISDQHFRSQKFKIAKIFNLCGRHRRRPEPRRPEGPRAAAATAAQIENLCEKVGGRLDLGVGLRFPEGRGLRGFGVS